MILKQKLNYSWNRKHKYNANYVISDSRLNIAEACVYLCHISVLIGGFGEFGGKKIEISKIQDGGGRHLDKSKSKIAIPRPVSVTMRTVQSWTCELAYGADTIFHRTYF